MKRKTGTTLIVIIVLGLCILGTWLYFRPADSSTFSGFIKSLKQNDYKVKDVTEDYAKKSSHKMPENQRILTVDRYEVFVSIEEAETVNAYMKKAMSSFQNGSIDFAGIPHLYRKDNLVVTYFGNDEKLLNTLEDILGKSFIN